MVVEWSTLALYNIIINFKLCYLKCNKRKFKIIYLWVLLFSPPTLSSDSLLLCSYFNMMIHVKVKGIGYLPFNFSFNRILSKTINMNFCSLFTKSKLQIKWFTLTNQDACVAQINYFLKLDRRHNIIFLQDVFIAKRSVHSWGEASPKDIFGTRPKIFLWFKNVLVLKAIGTNHAEISNK